MKSARRWSCSPLPLWTTPATTTWPSMRGRPRCCGPPPPPPPPPPPIRVGCCQVNPSDKLEVLGVIFDKTLSPSPHLHSLISSTKTLSAMAGRLSLHLPLPSLRAVVGTILRGRLGYACMVLQPRLSTSDPSSALMAQLQVGVNNVARAIIGCKKSDRLHVEDLLKSAGLPSINRLVIYTIAMECWRALNLRDVPVGPLNPLGGLLSPPNSGLRRTRAATSGCLPPPTKCQVNSFVWWAYTCWNSSDQLRAAKTVSAAKRAANELAAAAPI